MMPGAAIVGAALNTAATRSKGLWVGGVDVIKDPVAPVDYAVPIDSIRVSEAGPGNVSSMEFVIECVSALTVAVSDGMDVRFWDLNATSQYPNFTGWVDHVSIADMPGQQGTRYEVSCTGIEAILDWSLIAADLVIPAATASDAAVFSCVANATGNAMGWMFAGGVNTGRVAPNVATSLNAAVTIAAGTTLREAIRLVGAQVTVDPVLVASLGGGTAAAYATIDMYGYLCWFVANEFGVAADTGFGNLSFGSSVAQFMENLDYGIDGSSVRGVIVKGTGVTAVVTDGSGKPGGLALISDTNITTAAAAQSAGLAYLAPYASKARGSLVRSDWSPSPTALLHPGGNITIADVRVFAVSSTFQCTGIDKTWNPSQRENWTIAFGGNAPSVTALTRQFTRSILS